MSATIREIVNDALTVIGEVSGAGTQTYSDDRMFADTIRIFNLLFKKRSWEQYRQWFQLTLDGTTGKITTDAFTNVRDFEDFYSVHPDGIQNPMPVLPRRLNPFTLGTGTTLMYWDSLPVTDTSYAKKRLQFWPKTSTGKINVQARVYPKTVTENWDWADTMYLDKDMMVCGVAYITLSSDDLNAGQAEAQKAMMEQRYKDIEAQLSDKPISIDGSGANIPTQWFTPPY